MGIKVGWINEEQGVVLWEYGADFSLQDFRAATKTTWQLVYECPQVCVISDMSDVLKPPPRFITALHSFHRYAPRNYKITLVVGANSYVEMVFSVVSKLPIARKKYIMLPTMDGAIALATEQYRVNNDNSEVSTQSF